MRSNNPAFSRNEAFTRNGYATFDVSTPSAESLESQYGMPSPVREPAMTLEDVVTRTGIMFVLLLATAVPMFFWTAPGVTSVLPYALTIGAALVGFVLAMVVSFSKKINVPLILAYAVVEGVFVGGISGLFTNSFGQGLVPQAVLGTLAAFVAMLVAYRTGLIRATKRFRKVMTIALIGYAVIALVNLGLVLIPGYSLYFDTGILGILLAGVGVTLASLTLVLDFDFVEQGIRNQLPEKWAWRAAFGLVVTLVWLYVEILRLLAILRGN